MQRLTELSYHDITIRLKKFGFKYYRPRKSSHELWVRDIDGKAVPVPH